MSDTRPLITDFTEELVDRWIEQVKVEITKQQRRLEYFCRLKAKFTYEELEKP